MNLCGIIFFFFCVIDWGIDFKDVSLGFRQFSMVYIEIYWSFSSFFLLFFNNFFIFAHTSHTYFRTWTIDTHVTDNLQPYNNITQNDPFPQFLQYSYNLYIDGNAFYTVIFLSEVQNSPHLSKNLSISFKLFAISFSTSNSDLILLRKFGSIGIFSFNLQP